METEINNEGEVKDFNEVVPVEPTEDEELIDEEEKETPTSSSDEDNEPDTEETEETEETEKETEEEPEKETEEVSEETEETKETVEEDQEVEEPIIEPKPVEGETPKERALRMETSRLRGLLRKERQDELFTKQSPVSEEPNSELDQYDPEEIKRFKSLAKAVGFVEKDELIRETIFEKNNNEFDTFLESHPEYLPENDSDGLLWNQFKSEFGLYNSPQDPKTLRKILNKVHNEIFGVQPTLNINKINASREKIKVASHTGASAGNKTNRQAPKPSGLRLDALKGFSDDDIDDIFGG